MLLLGRNTAVLRVSKCVYPHFLVYVAIAIVQFNRTI